MAVYDSKEWREFFDTYASLSELWLPSKREKKKSREKAWKVLLKKYEAVDPKADESRLKQRVASIRFCYKRELKKVQKSLLKAVTEDDIYSPNLWYYDKLEFLKDYLGTRSTNSHKSEIKEQIDETSFTDSDSMPNLSIPDPYSSCREETINIVPKDNAITCAEQYKQMDDADFYASCWARSFSKLSTLQQIYAKQAIDEILIRGQLQQLTQNYLAPIPVPQVAGYLLTKNITTAPIVFQT
ncbi:uncharacterized protein LOC119677948 [Teleopsis dalmanni]|uniref:uncharacterized protein LOC119677937 n=1 Tax=Teleopsis dalmanni TaxID=139649 RepID=UPI0018CDFA79|nr:uncharacterized protein LOC119677937 [Teleopsis dalmanni]XP_037945463.1 uncharacterized protein LOC119677948 [Teleopsis dalmanni]